MYLPPSFAETRAEVLRDLIHTHPLATLVALSSDGLVANHLPLQLDSADGTPGLLRGHIARANPLWRNYQAGTDALAIFHGPQAYVSPSWYPSKVATGAVVPTWNYVVVHAHGPLRFIDDPVWLQAHVTALTAQHEGSRPTPWQVSDAPPPYLANMLQAIVGFELPVTRIEGKWKLSQNRTELDRAGAAQGLQTSDDPHAQQVGRLVADRART